MENESMIELIHDVDCVLTRVQEQNGLRSFSIRLTDSGAQKVLPNHEIGEIVSCIILFENSKVTGKALVGDPIMKGTGPLKDIDT